MKRPPPRLSLDLLRAFCAAATHLSFTRAARDQFVTPSAISHAIHTLEKQLEQPLFCRVNRALKLTHAGESVSSATVLARASAAESDAALAEPPADRDTDSRFPRSAVR